MRTVLASLTLLLLLTGCATSNERRPHSRATRDALATLCAVEESAGRLSGQVIVVRDGEIIHRSTHGRAEYALDVPVTDATRFKIFSTTKHFTAAAVLLLQHDQRLRTSDSIRTHFPEAPASWQPVTIHHLLTHTSGIPEFLGALSTHQHPTQLDSVRAALATPEVQALAPTFSPGSEFAYSNSGYTMLGAIIERASAMTYADFLRTRIFHPAGMSTAACETPVFADHGQGPTDIGFAPAPNLAAGYSGSPGALAETLAYIYIIMGAGGIYATADDLLRYDESLRAGSVIPHELQRAMIDNAWDNPDPARADVGYGWFIRTRHGRQMCSHSGGTNGYTCEFARIPADGVCIIILTNLGFANPEALRDRILDILYAGPDAHRP